MINVSWIAAICCGASGPPQLYRQGFTFEIQSGSVPKIEKIFCAFYLVLILLLEAVMRQLLKTCPLNAAEECREELEYLRSKLLLICSSSFMTIFITRE